MPLTPLNKVHREFPSIFAEKMSQHVRQRARSYQQYRSTTEDVVMEPLDDAEISQMCDSDGEVAPNSLGHSHSRLTPEMQMLKTLNSATTPRSTSESESEASSATTTPHPRLSPSPRGLPVKMQESPRPMTGFVPAFAVSPRRPRQSPRTTGSLDNVDLWEESDNDSSDFDTTDSGIIDPLKTFDFSDLRRSKSPVECKRNKLSNESQKTELHVCAPPTRDKSRDRHFSAARARAARRLKQIFPNPAVSKPRLHIAKPSTNIVENMEATSEAAATTTATTTTTAVASIKKKLLPQRESRLAAKFPAFAIQDSDKVKHTSKHKLLPVTKDKASAKNRNLQLEYGDVTNITKGLPTKCSEKDNLKQEKLKVKDVKANKGENSGNNSDISPNITAEEPVMSRKVKFNSFVTVRDDQINTLDFLKHSNNSAKMFKNRYLKPPDTNKQNGVYSDNDVNLMLQTIS